MLDCITVQKVRSLSGDRWFARGEAYAQQGRVKNLSTDENTLFAKVSGTQTYSVRISCRNSRMQYSCTCPVGDDGNFCKHCVAVALAWLADPAPEPETRPARSDLRSFLENYDHSSLIDLIIDEASMNSRLRERLEFASARSRAAGPDLSVFRKAITHATRTAGIDYYSMPRFARRLVEVIDSISGLLTDGHSKAVVELTEYALTRLEKAIGEVDDSDGHFGNILPNLLQLHHDACLQSDEDPAALAKRLFARGVSSQWDFFADAVTTYADVFGAQGLSEYRRLAEEKWARVTALKPGDESNEPNGQQRYWITAIMETLARQSGDLEALVEVKRRDLSHPYSFLQIAEIYRDAKQFDKALEWAEKGASSFSRNDVRLSGFLVTEYHRRGRHSEAMHLVWKEFVEQPCLETYRKLRINALKVKTARDKLRLVKTAEGGVHELPPEPSGTGEWSRWRKQAIEHIRERSDEYEDETARRTKAASSQQTPFLQPRWITDRSLLVEIFLWEKNYEAAWEETTSGGCDDSLWLQLADAIADDHPDRAYPVYKEMIAPTVELGNNDAYAQAYELLKKMQGLASRLKRESDLDDYVAALRVEYKRKRNFIKLIETM